MQLKIDFCSALSLDATSHAFDSLIIRHKGIVYPSYFHISYLYS